ncbi:MAG: DUF262 domain-containing protein [Prevotella sp.]|nr:DUF262 domain-containing protein [Prevotella sp.]
MDGSRNQFIIPLYQRNYDWKIENCKQLFNDLMTLHKSGRKTHFFGSIVSCIQADTGHWVIIDGQQRITTVSLLLIALVNAYKAGSIKAEKADKADEIYECFLVNKFKKSERKVKLKPIKKDMEAFDALIYKPEEQYIDGSNVTRNYKYLYDRVLKSGLTIDELCDAVEGLEVINILLDKDDDPQLIFESLNSTGLDLSEADKIRNYLLMSVPEKEQERLYTLYWNPIEEYTGYDPSAFVRDYLTMKQGKIGRIDRIYFIFKEYAEKNAAAGREGLLKDMHHYAKLYDMIDKGRFGPEKINGKMRRLRTLDSTVVYPFYMAFFDYAAGNNLSEAEQYEVMDVVEAYLARRIICNSPSNALNKVFAALHRDVLRYIDQNAGNAPAYVPVLKYVLTHKEGTAAFPDDGEVKDNFCTRQIYKMPPAARLFVMERLENRNNVEDDTDNLVDKIKSGVVTIEHIMPQTLSGEWKRALGADWERIHRQYLHTMANLTLTGYNSKYGNKSFIAKRDTEHGFKDSTFRLNKYVGSCSKWTEEELIHRQDELLGVCMDLWRMPATSFEPAKREALSASLDDDDDVFTGMKLQAYVFRGTRYPTKIWKDMLIRICKEMYAGERYTVDRLCALGKCGLSRTGGSGREEIEPGVYLWTANSTIAKIGILRDLFKECDIALSDLVFEYREDNERVQGAGEADEAGVLELSFLEPGEA